MRRLLFAAILSVFALSVWASTVTHSLVLAVHPALSADSLTPVNGGTTGRLVTIAGVWTFENFQHPSGNWSIQLNGANQNPNTTDATSAVQLYVLNGGVLYQVTQAGVWFSWTGAGPWTATTDPRSATPAMAQAAGYTTNIVKADFTGGGLYGTIGSWLRCGSDSNPALGFFATFYSSTGTSACSLFSITTDPLGGGQALKIHDPGNLSAPANAPSLEFGEFTSTFGAFSVAYYVKFTGRIQATRNTIGCCVFDFWQGVLAGFNNYGALFENDFFETSFNSPTIAQNEAIWQYNGCVSGVSDGQRCFGPGSQFGAGFAVDVTQYHTYERVGTTDGTSILWGCLVIDGVTNSPCVSEQPTNPTDIHALTDRNQVQIISNATSQFAPGAANDLYVKSFEMWACPNYATAGCTGPLITQWPQTLAPAFYVAIGGNDTNAGTLAAPFATIGKCQTAMRGDPTKKTCYIRAGTYTGSGVGYTRQTTSGGSWSVTEALFLTSADNNETWSYYPPDGYNTAIFDGNAGANGANCPQNAVGTGVHRGIYAAGASGLTINGLQFRFFCFSGISVNGGISTDCYPLATSGTLSGNLVENNIVHDIFSGSSQCNGGFVGGTGAIENSGTAGETVTHNVVFNNTGMGIRAGAPPGNGIDISGVTFSYNVVYNVNVGNLTNDSGGIYVGQCPTCTNMQVLYNYVNTYGTYGCSSTPTPGQCTNAFYDDDATSHITRTGNVARGDGGACYFANSGNSLLDTGNICDLGDTSRPTTFSSKGWYTQAGVPAGNTGPETNKNNIVIASASTCAGGANQCALQINNYPGTVVIGPNDYWNYNASGNSWFNAGATANGDTTPHNIDAFGNATTRCPGGNLNSWGYFIPPGNAVFSSPVNFPTQPAGWATPGFWGPPGYVVPHFGTTPSYGPTC